MKRLDRYIIHEILNTNMKKKINTAIIIMLLLSGTTAASPLGDWWNRINQIPQQQDTPAPVVDRWASLSNDLFLLNTPANIMMLSAYMELYNVRSIRVDVIDLQRSFYIVSGYGLYFQSTGGVDDVQVRLTEGQVREIMKMAQDGYVSPFERFRIWLLLRG